MVITVSRSEFFIDIMSLMRANVISREDLNDFSKEVTDWIDQFL